MRLSNCIGSHLTWGPKRAARVTREGGARRAQDGEGGRVQAAVLEPCRLAASADLADGAGDIQAWRALRRCTHTAWAPGARSASLGAADDTGMCSCVAPLRA